MKKLGLIGETLHHSFSKKYFREKFEKEEILDWVYDLYELENIGKFEQLLENEPLLVGLNVTSPYKQEVLKYIHELDDEAAAIGAINTIKFTTNGTLKGYNTDAIGFENSLIPFLGKAKLQDIKALILGTGGASKAILFVLNKLGIQSSYVSRSATKGLTYQQLDKQIVSQYKLIINCTPLGTFPLVDAAPPIPYELLTAQHFLYDLVYNPKKTLFLKRGEQQGAKTINGISMLALQAEASWNIWNKI
jgi:shikimate dehydrogenase